MSYSATRLTCFALISALEEDTRLHVEEAVGDLDPLNIFTKDEYDKVVDRCSRERISITHFSAATLIQFIDYADGVQLLNRFSNNIDADLKEQLPKLTQAISRITPVRNRVAHTRPMEIEDLSTVLDFCRSLRSKGNKQLWPSVGTVIEKLSENPSYVLSLNIDLKGDPDPGPMHNLPIPDFDETGFFGRKKQVERIKKIVKGAYPVVSILGDGGIGKTAIALKIAYDLLDDQNATFDAIVWVTAKSERLTASEVVRISGAIEDSLGLFANAAESLAGSFEGDPIEEVLSYLESFKVLLILDNLETVLDSRLREFLLEIPLGSKVIITSRIGVGVENPVSLGPLTDDEAERLLYFLARTREVDALKALSKDGMSRISKVMLGRPAYIKWFVSGVQAGKRPEELLRDNGLFLDYCMSNVHKFLRVNAQTVLKCMQVLPGVRTQSEIAFLCQFNADQTQAAILELLTTNFVHMRTQSGSREVETTYELTEFGRTYLEKRHPVSSDDRKKFQSNNHRLIALGRSLRDENSASPYDPGTLDVSAGEFGAARLLRLAGRKAEVRNFDQALQDCAEARRLSPNYFETWRVEAQIYAQSGDYSSARNAFDRAIELAPDSASLNYFFGSFLVDENIDPNDGLVYLRKAARKDSESPIVLRQISWANLANGSFREAFDSAIHVLTMPGASAYGVEMAVTALRAASYNLQKNINNGSIEQAMEFMEEVLQQTECISVEYLLGEPCDRLLLISEVCDSLRDHLDDDFLKRKVATFRSKSIEFVRRVDTSSLDRRIGRVKTIVPDKAYGFITLGLKDYFFHIRDLMSQQDWYHMESGVTVSFMPDNDNPKGIRAVSVAWLN
ncbi:tetratricopeptide repeat protein [Amycolatopsis sp. CA-126428]|uniref:tetratricopeptide repeat protein n=1 Tax=Amycolatopsis sp. CA-126428 TaxID=2073158 RepID=UPI000CD25BED|nr:tetratricopeptide repeat protein [Amycolatopsis sp. CA-126428]